MSNRLYVGNLSYDSTSESLRAAFASFGEVADVHVVTDRDSGRSRGFAFVTMGSPQEAADAIAQMNGALLDGRALRVNEAEERSPRGGGGGAGFYGNCYYIMRVSAPAGKVAGSSVTEVVKIIKDGKRRMPAEFARWAAGEVGAAGVDPYQITSDYRTLLVSDWTRLGFAEVDYGWGPPAHVVPLTNLDYIATCILVKPWAHKPGARLITQCVTPDRVAAFHEGMLDTSC